MPTGSYALNASTGIGGLPRGRIIEIYGKPSSGKTTVCLNVIREAQALGIITIFFDVEATFDARYGADARITLPDLIIVPGGSTEQIFEMITTIVDANPDNEYLFVLDSVGMMASNTVENKDLNDHNIGSNAKKLNESIVRLVGKQGNLKNCTLLAINHVHQQIGGRSKFPVWITTGGERLKYACSVRLDVANIEKLKSATSGADLGFRMKIKVTKNKVGAPNGVVELTYFYKTGFDISDELFEEGYRLGFIEKAETGIKWFFNGETFNGRPKLQAYILHEPGIKEMLAGKISEYYENPENADRKSFGIVVEDDENTITTLVKEDDTSSFIEAYDIQANEQNEFYNSTESVTLYDDSEIDYTPDETDTEEEKAEEEQKEDIEKEDVTE